MVVSDFLSHSAGANPDREAVVCAGRRLTYAALAERAARLSHGLLDLGLHRRERVAIHLANSVEAVVAIFAVLQAGAVVVVLSQLLKPRKVAAILDDSGAAVMLTDSPIGVHSAEASPAVRHIVTCGSAIATAPDPVATQHTPLGSLIDQVSEAAPGGRCR